MKKIILIILICAFCAVELFAQFAKKPTIMVVPSDVFCTSKGYVKLYNNKEMIPDYKAAFQNDKDLRLVITKMSKIMASRGFPLKDLEQELKNIAEMETELNAAASESNGRLTPENPIEGLKRRAKADIIIDLDFTVNKRGPERYISFNIKGLDAYTSKQISGAVGAGSPSSFATTDVLLEEAVLSHMDEFNTGLMKYFEDLFAKGREIKVFAMCAGGSTDMNSEFTYQGKEQELNVVIERWLELNCVQGRFSRTEGDETFVRFDQVRIPMLKKDETGKERGVDARSFIYDLYSMLKKEPFDLKLKIREKGLGEVWLVIGN